MFSRQSTHTQRGSLRIVPHALFCLWQHSVQSIVCRLEPTSKHSIPLSISYYGYNKYIMFYMKSVWNMKRLHVLKLYLLIWLLRLSCCSTTTPDSNIIIFKKQHMIIIAIFIVITNAIYFVIVINEKLHTVKVLARVSISCHADEVDIYSNRKQ